MGGKLKRDPRITAGAVSWKQFLVIFTAVLCICGNYHVSYLRYLENQPGRQNMFSGITLVLTASLIGTFMIGIFKQIYFDKPLRTIADAAKKVAEGDFSVRVKSCRHDGKKDYAEVLIEDFNTMVEELASIETLKTDFIANVSHEIKTPLSVIQSYATAIQDDGLLPEERHEYGRTIAEASKKLSELVMNILKLNKLEHQEIVPVREIYALDEQLRECVLNYEELWDKKNITLVGDDIEEMCVNYDKALLELVWNNLISNAIKFTEEGGTIRVSLKKDRNFAVIHISDSGCGMGAETTVHIFDRFYQGDTSHSTEGNGLGLALVKRVVALLGGEISVNSRINVGTTMSVRLKI